MKHIITIVVETSFLILTCSLFAGDSEPPQDETRPWDVRPKFSKREVLPVGVLETFLGRLAAGEHDKAYGIVAPSSKEKGDPIAYYAPLDYEAFLRELPQESGRSKFEKYTFGAFRWENAGRLRIWLNFGGDRDESLLLLEGNRWYVADPIHIIR